MAHITLLKLHDKGVRSWDTLFLVNNSFMGLFYVQASLLSFPFTHLTREP